MNPLSDLATELANTRTTLERVPEDKFDYKPHPKSFSLVELANHVAEIPGWGPFTINQDGMEFDGMQPPPRPRSVQDILDKFDKSAADLTAAVQGADEATLQGTWTATMKGQPVISATKAELLRGMIINHMIHHRAQLTVYLRMLDVPVPALYGPSADEGPRWDTASA